MSNSSKNISAAAIENLASQLRGKISLPNDAAYNDTRKVYNAMID
jgi:hypothetical protein